MNRFKKIIATGVALAATGLTLTACDADDAEVVNHNLTKAADNFEIMRRVVVVNGITDKYMLSIEGLCSLDPKEGRVWITCKVGEGEGADSYKRHQIYTSDNVFVLSEQLEAVQASAYHYRVTFKPQTILPDIDFRGDTSDHPVTD